MPRERLNKDTAGHIAPESVYVSLQSLIKLQFEIKGFSLLPKQPVQSLLTGKHRSKMRGRGLDFEEVRAYAHGDDIRNIDWKVTARVRKPHTKVYTEERERPVFIITDQSASMFFGSTGNVKSVSAAHLAALAAWKVLAVGDRVGGIVFNDQNFTEIKPRRDRKAVQSYLQMVVEKNNALSALSMLKHDPEMLNKVLRKTINLVNHDYLVLVLSDFYTLDEQTMKSLISISRHNDVILVMITDPMEANLPEGDLIFSNGDLQVAANAENKNFKTEFINHALKRITHIRDKARAYGITLLEINTVEPVSNQIRTLLNHGRKIK